MLALAAGLTSGPAPGRTEFNPFSVTFPHGTNSPIERKSIPLYGEFAISFPHQQCLSGR